MEALPAPGVNPAIDHFVAGNEGSSLLFNPTGASARIDQGDSRRGLVRGRPAASQRSLRPDRVMQQRMLLAAIVLTLLAWALTWWMVRRPARTVGRCRECAGDIRARPTDSPQALPITSKDEIGELIGSLQSPAGNLVKREAALKESEYRWKFAIEGSGDGLWDWNNGDNTVFFSTRWKADARLYRRRDTRQRWRNGNSAYTRRTWQQPLATGAGCPRTAASRPTREHRVLRCKDGSYKWILEPRHGGQPRQGRQGAPCASSAPTWTSPSACGPKARSGSARKGSERPSTSPRRDGHQPACLTACTSPSTAASPASSATTRTT
jgi:PAS domain-containing protein